MLPIFFCNISIMSTSQRVAQPGDIFVLLVPNGVDQEHLNQKHNSLQAHFGGQAVLPIHITTQRFSPGNGQITTNCIETLRESLSGFQPFPIIADALIQFFAPYWQCQVLRWRVQETPAWANFRDQLENTLHDNR